MKRKNCILFTLLLFSLVIITSCGGEEDDEVIVNRELALSTSTIDFGDVEQGAEAVSSTATATITDITGELVVAVTGDGYSVNATSFTIGDSPIEVTISFTAGAEFPAGTATGSVTFTAGALSETIALTANVTAIDSGGGGDEGLDDGTVVFSTGFEFGITDNNTTLTTSDFEGLTPTLYEGVTVTYEVVAIEENDVNAYTSNALCGDTKGVEADSLATAGPDCGNAVLIKQADSKVAINLSGVPASQTYSVTFWVRATNSARSMDYILGDNTLSMTFEGYDNDYFVKFVMSGQSDASGNLSFTMLQTTTENSGRSLIMDEVEIVAGEL